MTPSKAIGPHAPGQGSPIAQQWQRHGPLALLLLSLVVLYAPTVWSLAHGLWQDDTHSHGPLVLLAVTWLFWRGIRAHAQHAEPQPRTLAGALVLGLGLVVYVLGRSQGLYVLEVGSAIPVVLGGVLLTWGAPLARRLWFAFVFLLFLVPLPGSLIDTITQPMKIAVSWAAEHLMYALGYPVARAGVVLGIGPYQLFVADACAGLNSLFMLEAFGLLYLNVVRHESVLRNAVLAVLIVPISFIANVLRVVVLALVTYHYGDAAGQGFIHSFSGVVLFGVALVLTVGADSLLRALPTRRQRPAAGSASATRSLTEAARQPLALGSPRLSNSLALATSAILASALAIAATPKLRPIAALPNLESSIPQSFGDWKGVPLRQVPVDVAVLEPGKTTIQSPYDSVLMRAYENSKGFVIALAIGYGANQRQEIKVHRPDLCYEAQGYRVSGLRPISFDLQTGTGSPLVGKRMYAASAQGNEAVVYWLRIGEIFSESAWESRLHIFLRGLNGHVVDGMLVRASLTVADESDAVAAEPLLKNFLEELVVSSSTDVRRLLSP